MLGLAVPVVALVAPPALAQEGTSVGYATRISSPQMQPEGWAVARGTVSVEASVGEGGVGDAKYAAFHARLPGTSWSQDLAVAMAPVAEGRFASTQPWDTALLENGDYRLEVRIWGDVPPYDANEERTYSREVFDVKVDNAPPRPGRPSVSTTPGSLVVTWPAAATSERTDFAGYSVWRQKRRSGCARSLTLYKHLADVVETHLALETKTRARYCFRVVARRISTVTGTVASSPSRAVAVVARVAAPGTGGAPGARRGATGKPRKLPPPRAPALSGGSRLAISDGTYGDRLPYSSRRVLRRIRAAQELEVQASSGREPGADPRRTPASIAAGLILAMGALLVRRLLAEDRSLPIP